MSLMTIYMMKLGLKNEFIYYIHPRYIIFSILATLVCGYVVLQICRYYHEIHYHEGKKVDLFSFFIIGVLVFAIIHPAQGLTAATALKRFQQNQQITQIKKKIAAPKPTEVMKDESPKVGTKLSDDARVENISPTDEAIVERAVVESEDKAVIEDATKDTSGVFSEWIYELTIAEDLSSFQGKKIELTGFVLINEEDDNPRQFYVTRFFLACCTADAQPTGIAFKYSGNEFKNDDWIKIKGTINVIGDGGLERPIIVPQSIEKTVEPEAPYAYY